MENVSDSHQIHDEPPGECTKCRLDFALLQIEELKKENSRLFDQCDEQGRQLGTICDERGAALEVANRLYRGL